ncbi:Scr1 family TA system antitoxin-like transcriptional regulator [Streptomyces gamaensis]|uniref:Scr1 family TA system antitoxin-like transcriptional regulator n=1 Tax=Streptomyces gamaensis TaxID=1763542 RepID=A0ABW0Z7J1_9ACTN
MPAPKPNDPYQARVAKLGLTIKEYRVRKRWTQGQLGKAVALTKFAISHFESGAHIPLRETAALIDGALGAGGRIRRMREELDDNPDARLIQRVFKIEQRAVRIRHVGGLVPALLQNPAYERAIIEQNISYLGGDVEEKLKYRALRHEILKRPDPPSLSVVLGEAALHAVIGGLAVMRSQLLDLIDASRRPGIDLRIAPFSRDAQLIQQLGEFSLMDRRGEGPAVYVSAGVRGILVTKPPAVDEYVTIYDLLHARALDAEASRVLIRKAIREMYPDAHH